MYTNATYAEMQQAADTAVMHAVVQAARMREQVVEQTTTR